VATAATMPQMTTIVSMLCLVSGKFDRHACSHDGIEFSEACAATDNAATAPHRFQRKYVSEGLDPTHAFDFYSSSRRSPENHHHQMRSPPYCHAQIIASQAPEIVETTGKSSVDARQMQAYPTASARVW
ncbi:MAG: hypothetical protein AAFQ00_07230, partial [Pseudomonadota bacterium]